MLTTFHSFPADSMVNGQKSFLEKSILYIFYCFVQLNTYSRQDELDMGK